jgi:hypothetical protein
MWTKQTLILLGAAAVLGFTGAVGAESPAGSASTNDQKNTGRYHGFAEGNPELPYDGDGEPGINPVPADNPSRTVDETQV